MTPPDQPSADAVRALSLARTLLPLEQSGDVTAWLAAIVTSSNDAIISKTLDGIITTWNPAAERLFGYTAEEAVGQSITLIVPPDRQGEFAEIMERLARGESIAQQATERVRKDGARVAVSLSISPVRDATGRIVGAAKVSHDLTERMRLEAAEAESRIQEEQRDQLRIILDHLPAGVLILSGSDGQVEQANTTALQMIFGPSAARDMLPVYGRDFRFLRVDGTPLTHEQHLGIRTLYGEMAGHEHLLLERHDGHLLPVLAHAAPLPETVGQQARAVLVQQDISRLREAEQLKDDFLALISHEFRTPLTTIHGGAHLLLKQRAALSEVTQDELLSDIASESERLDHLLANLLTLAAVMAGRLEVSTEPVLLAPLVNQVVPVVAHQFPQHALRVAIPPGLPAVEADPALVREVLTNLYENAAKYSPPGTAIVTTANPDGTEIALSVTDAGIGIPVDQLGRIFSRFHRVDPASPVRGTGLGLYLSRALIEAQGGHLVAHSAGPGNGSTFTITLPIAAKWTSSD